MKRKNNINKSSIIVSVLSCILFASAIVAGASDHWIPDHKSIYVWENVSVHGENVNDTIRKTEATAKVLGVPLKNIDVDVLPKRRLIPCGDVFGVKFFTKGVMIVGMSDVESEDGIFNPAYNAGLRVGDNIVSLNGKAVNTIEEVSDMITVSEGNTMIIIYEREGKEYTASFKAIKSLSDGKYRSGMWVRDSTAGIGTITYYDPDTGSFAGLGHGICDIDTGKLMPMLKGNIVDIDVNDIIRGTNGVPGEIKGEFDIIKKGELIHNSERGVFGVLDERPLCAFGEPVDIAMKTDVKEGMAYIYASLGNESINKYEIELTKIYHNDSETKNFIFTVKDGELLDKTGGIVQGMSGSPIIQNGKLIGAVTHVLVNDPTRGYGIFIENMLAEAEKIK